MKPPVLGIPGASLCLLALAVVVKPLAQAIGNHLRYDSYDNIGYDLDHPAHLPSVARMEKGSVFSIAYSTKHCNF
jgi:hypothetical protein